MYFFLFLLKQVNAISFKPSYNSKFIWVLLSAHPYATAVGQPRPDWRSDERQRPTPRLRTLWPPRLDERRFPGVWRPVPSPACSAAGRRSPVSPRPHLRLPSAAITYFLLLPLPTRCRQPRTWRSSNPLSPQRRLGFSFCPYTEEGRRRGHQRSPAFLPPDAVVPTLPSPLLPGRNVGEPCNISDLLLVGALIEFISCSGQSSLGFGTGLHHVQCRTFPFSLLLNFLQILPIVFCFSFLFWLCRSLETLLFVG
jgi:hypothetical protein